MKILNIILKDLFQLVHDWRTAVFLFAMPIVFTLMFGFAFGGFNTEQDTRIPVAIVNMDESGPYSGFMIELLDNSDVIRLVNPSRRQLSRLEEMVSDRDVEAVLVIPEGYSQTLKNGSIEKLQVLINAESGSAFALQGVLQSAANKMLAAADTAASTVELLNEKDISVQDTEYDAVFVETINAWQNPPLDVKNLPPQNLGESGQQIDNAFAHSLPGMMLQFAIAGLTAAAEIIVVEKKTRTLQRLITTKTTVVEIILGHFLSIFVIIFLQLIILIGFGQIFLRLNFMSQWGATLLLSALVAMVIASMGLLIGTLAKTEEQSILFALIPMFILSGLGGAWIPLEFTGKVFQTIGHFTPVAWAMDGYKDILLRGLGISSMTDIFLVLAGYAVILFGLAVGLFRRRLV
jgi:ABC-2 type transport system permease protein